MPDLLFSLMHAVRNTAEQITASGELPALCCHPHDSPSAMLSKCSGRQRQNTQVYVSERACGGIASWMGERLDPHPGSSGACICKWIGPDLLDPSQGDLYDACAIDNAADTWLELFLVCAHFLAPMNQGLPTKTTWEVPLAQRCHI